MRKIQINIGEINEDELTFDCMCKGGKLDLELLDTIIRALFQFKHDHFMTEDRVYESNGSVPRFVKE